MSDKDKVRAPTSLTFL